MIDHLRINDVAPTVHYDCDGVQAAFTFPFAVFKVADLEVWVDDARALSGFTVSGAGISAGGSVLFAVPPAQGVRLTLRRRMALARVSDFQTDGIIRAKTLNDELDYQVAAVQQVADDVSRCIQRPLTSTSAADLTLPDPVGGKAIGWNADATGLVNDPADFAASVATVTARSAAAEASRVAAEAAATAAAGDRASVAADRQAVASDLIAAADHCATAVSAAAAAAASEATATARRDGAVSAAGAAATSEAAAASSRDAAALSAAVAVTAETQSAACRDAAAASATAAAAAEAGALGHKNAAAVSATIAQTYAGQAQAAANIQTFSTVAVAGQPSIMADLAGDTLVLAAGANITLMTDPVSDTLTVSVAGLSTVATSGAYADLTGKPALGSAAAATLGTGAGQVPTSDQVPGLVQGVPTGSVVPYAGLFVPTGWLACDGSAVSRATYAALFAALVKSAAVTISIASPGVVTWSGHGLSNGQAVVLRTTGALPTGLVAGTSYYVVNAAADSFQLSATAGGAAIATSGSQSGIHTATAAAYGDGDGSTTFTLPDLRGRTAIGAGQGSGLSNRVPGSKFGAETHTLSTAEVPAHNHVLQQNGAGGGTYNPTGDYGRNGWAAVSSTMSGVTPIVSENTGGGAAHNNMPPSLVVKFIIKT